MEQMIEKDNEIVSLISQKKIDMNLSEVKKIDMQISEFQEIFSKKTSEVELLKIEFSFLLDILSQD